MIKQNMDSSDQATPPSKEEMWEIMKELISREDFEEGWPRFVKKYGEPSGDDLGKGEA
jgi:hypothetical protein